MYSNAMDAIHKHLVKKSVGSNMIYTSELIPERHASGDVHVFTATSPLFLA
jgi:mannosyl-oligosaccharide alpha-1,2-mannosidase